MDNDTPGTGGGTVATFASVIAAVTTPILVTATPKDGRRRRQRRRWRQQRRSGHAQTCRHGGHECLIARPKATDKVEARLSKVVTHKVWVLASRAQAAEADVALIRKTTCAAGGGAVATGRSTVGGTHNASNMGGGTTSTATTGTSVVTTVCTATKGTGHCRSSQPCRRWCLANGGRRGVDGVRDGAVAACLAFAAKRVVVAIGPPLLVILAVNVHGAPIMSWSTTLPGVHRRNEVLRVVNVRLDLPAQVPRNEPIGHPVGRLWAAPRQ